MFSAKSASVFWQIVQKRVRRTAPPTLSRRCWHRAAVNTRASVRPGTTPCRQKNARCLQRNFRQIIYRCEHRRRIDVYGNRHRAGGLSLTFATWHTYTGPALANWDFCVCTNSLRRRCCKSTAHRSKSHQLRGALPQS